MTVVSTANDLRSRLQIGPIQSLLLWTARADLAALCICPYACRQTLIGMGLAQVFVFAITFIAGFITISDILSSLPIVPLGLAAPLVALVLASGMLLVNRAILAFEVTDSPADAVDAFDQAIAVYLPADSNVPERQLQHRYVR